MTPDRKDALPAKHSQGPLSIGRTFNTHDHPNRYWRTYIDGANNLGMVAETFGATLEEAEANASRFVQCWNSHDELVEALRAAKAELDYQREGHIELPRIDRERLKHLARMAESAITNATQGEA
jgi:hypothetical protein